MILGLKKQTFRRFQPSTNTQGVVSAGAFLQTDFMGAIQPLTAKEREALDAYGFATRAQYKLFTRAELHTTDASTDIASTLMGKDYRMTAVAYYSNDTKYFDVGWLCGFLAKSFDERAPTAVYQTVQGIAPDVDNVGEQDHIESKNANYYSTLKGQGATFGGTVASGHDIEHIVTGLWVKARLSEQIAALFLAATDRGERIPYSDTGIAMFEQATYDVLKLGERIGHFNPGSSAVKMPRRADVAPADVQTGTLRYSWGAQYSGVIKEVSIQGYVSLEFEGFGE